MSNGSQGAQASSCSSRSVLASPTTSFILEAYENPNLTDSIDLRVGPI
jgi:hypothetical protein